MCLEVAGDDVCRARELYERWDYAQVLEWHACMMAKHWERPPLFTKNDLALLALDDDNEQESAGADE
ncbi:MAG TPA: hypothetical protein VHI13_16835 [Candidatus Kapabacteria bacterium]|nr:hypothetical protein [Candidatus Kapabacteria bacterium]